MVKFLTNTTVKANFFKGTVFSDNKQFRITNLRGKAISLGYPNDFSKAQLGEFIEELKAVHNTMEDENDTTDKEATERKLETD